MLKVVFFGTPQIHLNHICITYAFSHYELALFAYLIMTGKPLQRSFLAEMLWPNEPQWQAKIKLRNLLCRLQRKVGRYLNISRRSIVFNHQAPYWLDIKVFTDYLSPDSNISKAVVSPEILKQLLALYNDEFLGGLNLQGASQFNEWVSDQRRNLHNLMNKTAMSGAKL